MTSYNSDDRENANARMETILEDLTQSSDSGSMAYQELTDELDGFENQSVHDLNASLEKSTGIYNDFKEAERQMPDSTSVREVQDELKGSYSAFKESANNVEQLANDESYKTDLEGAIDEANNALRQFGDHIDEDKKEEIKEEIKTAEDWLDDLEKLQDNARQKYGQYSDEYEGDSPNNVEESLASLHDLARDLDGLENEHLKSNPLDKHMKSKRIKEKGRKLPKEKVPSQKQLDNVWL